MKREIVTFPAGFLKHLKCDWDIDWRGQDSGERNSGSTQIVHNTFPRWIGTVNVFLDAAAIPQWHAIRAQAQGRLGIYVVEMFDPAGFEASDQFQNGIPHSTDALFSTGNGYAYDPFCVAHVAASAGATTIRVDTSGAGIVPRIGQIMSHNDRPFRVTWVSQVAGDVYDLGIQMPLRSGIEAGGVINHQGRGRFELVEVGNGQAIYGADRVGRPSITLREVLTR